MADLALVALSLAAFGAAFLGIHSALLVERWDTVWFIGAIGLLVGGTLGLVFGIWAARFRRLSSTPLGAEHDVFPRNPSQVTPQKKAEVALPGVPKPQTDVDPIGDQLRGSLVALANAVPQDMKERLDGLQSGIEAIGKVLATQRRILSRFEAESGRLLQERLDTAQRRIRGLLQDLRSEYGSSELWLLRMIAGESAMPDISDFSSLQQELRNLVRSLLDGPGGKSMLDLAERLTELDNAEREVGRLAQSLQGQSRLPTALADDLGRIESRLSQVQIAPDNAAVHQQLADLRGRVIEALGREYRVHVGMSSNLNYARVVGEVLQQLDLTLIEITPRETRLDERYHRRVQGTPDSSVEPNTILSVMRMGYIDEGTQEIVRAEVITSLEGF